MRDDFIKLTLSAKGEAAGGLRVVGSTYDYAFTRGVELELPRAEAAARLGDALAAGLIEEVKPQTAMRARTRSTEE